MTTKSVEETMELTPKHLPGFAARLETALPFSGIHEYGKLSALARFTDMSAAGVKLLFSHDRPPRHLNKFRMLTQGLVEQIRSHSGRGIKQNQLSDFLLYNSRSPFTESERFPGISSREAFEEFDTVFLGRIYVFIDEVAKENGINMFQDLQPGMLKIIIDRVLLLFSEQKADLKSKSTKELVKSTILLGQAGML